MLSTGWKTVCLCTLALTSRTSSVWSEVRMLTVTFWPLERQMSRATSSVGICWVSCGKDTVTKHNRLSSNFMGKLHVFIPVGQQQKHTESHGQKKETCWSERRYIFSRQRKQNIQASYPFHTYTFHKAQIIPPCKSKWHWIEFLLHFAQMSLIGAAASIHLFSKGKTRNMVCEGQFYSSNTSKSVKDVNQRERTLKQMSFVCLIVYWHRLRTDLRCYEIISVSKSSIEKWKLTVNSLIKVAAMFMFSHQQLQLLYLSTSSIVPGTNSLIDCFHYQLFSRFV